MKKFVARHWLYWACWFSSSVVAALMLGPGWKSGLVACFCFFLGFLAGWNDFRQLRKRSLERESELQKFLVDATAMREHFFGKMLQAGFKTPGRRTTTPEA